MSDKKVEEYRLLSSDENGEPPQDTARSEILMKVGSALSYGIASFLLTIFNKTVLTSWQFPSFLVISVGQLAAAIIVLFIGKQMKIISFPDYDNSIPRKIMPLPFFHFGNMASGLGGTQVWKRILYTSQIKINVISSNVFVICREKEMNHLIQYQRKCDQNKKTLTTVFIIRVFVFKALFASNSNAFYYSIQAMPLPMFTALRRFSILITMLLEFKILGVKPSLAVQLSVWSMIGGAILAASDDLSFTFEGYSYVMLANIITAAYGVVSACECDLHIIVMF